jgi:hypothetical protein
MGLIALAGGLGLFATCSMALAEEPTVERPLVVLERAGIEAALPPDARPLIRADAIERFLDELDGAPPDWKAVYGLGHRDPEHDERLFELNRERDRRREGKPALQQRVTFVWPGELSGYEPESGGFRVAIGPKVNPTRWGWVRFKADGLPSNLVAIPPADLRELLRRKISNGEKVEIEVVMTGRLIPEESIVYDFAHEEEGRGLVMPVVRIEQVEYLMVE